VNVAVHCAPLHRLHAQLTDSKYSKHVATFVTNIGYLRAPKGFREWSFDRAAADPTLLTAIGNTTIQDALPFLEQFTDAASLVRGCKSYGIAEYNLIRIPALHFLMGEHQHAASCLLSGLAHLGDRSDAAAEIFRSAAARLLERCGFTK
jgi:hypothetical protein